MRHHIKIVASNFGLNYEHLYEFCKTLRHTSNYSYTGLEITKTICEDGKFFIDVPTSGTEKLIKLFDEHLKTNAIKYLPLKTVNTKYFDLTFQALGNSENQEKQWTCYYFDKFNGLLDKRIDTVFGSSIEDCAYKMYKQLNVTK